MSSYREWPHAPSHLFVPDASYIVTAGTYKKALLFDTPDKRDYLLDLLFEEAERFQWALEAWAVMGNHYHFVARAPEDAKSLEPMMRSIHSKSAIWLNEKGGAPERKVWFQYWDTCLTYEKSYLARIAYVHNNPVKHGLVKDAETYRWCSKAWFMREVPVGFRKTVLSFKYDRVNVQDNF